MSNENKTPYAIFLTILITLTGWGVTFGVMQQKSETNARDIERLEKMHNADVARVESKQNDNDALLQSINSQLAALNAKMELLLNGNINK